MRILFLLLVSLNMTAIFAQTQDEMLEEFMQQRRKMMESMMQMFDDSFEDDFFNMDDPFSKMNGFKTGGSSIDIEEKHEEDGSISLIIKPRNKNINLDIQTNEDHITIKSQTKQIQETDEEGNVFKSSSFSSFTRSISIPEGYKASSPEAVNGAIKISLKPQGKVKQIEDKDRKPLPKQGDII